MGTVVVRTDLFSCIFGQYLYTVWVALGMKDNRWCLVNCLIPSSKTLNIFSEY
jgi:hypothetical protein